MRRLFRSYPFRASLGLAAAIFAFAAIVALPRLDGIEIRAAVPTVDPTAGVRLEVEVAYRLASAPGAVVTLSAVDRKPPVSVTAPVGEGYGTVTLALSVSDGDQVVLVAELNPAGGATGLLAELQRERRRDVTVVSLRVPPTPLP